jgi:hypothetical protein
MDFIFDEKIPFKVRLKRVLDIQLLSSPLYSRFYSILGKNDLNTIEGSDIPLLPIRGFKQTKIILQGKVSDVVFQSSGTLSTEKSKHYIADLTLYSKSIEKEFYKHFPEEEFSILAYTPGYNENPDSSLLWMINHLINRDKSGLSGFLSIGEALRKNRVETISEKGKKVVLFGAAFGLLDLIDAKSDTLPEGSEIIETGGMKTHRREMSKNELRSRLSDSFGISGSSIHSEYGMCELLSQCYALGGEWFKPPHWVDISIRKESDPNRICKPGEEGKIGIIDLANVNSCPFILTEDRGVMNEMGEFQVLGRWNKDNLRGCNFLIDID